MLRSEVSRTGHAHPSRGEGPCQPKSLGWYDPGKDARPGSALGQNGRHLVPITGAGRVRGQEVDLGR